MLSRHHGEDSGSPPQPGRRSNPADSMEQAQQRWSELRPTNWQVCEAIPNFRGLHPPYFRWDFRFGLRHYLSPVRWRSLRPMRYIVDGEGACIAIGVQSPVRIKHADVN